MLVRVILVRRRILLAIVATIRRRIWMLVLIGRGLRYSVARRLCIAIIASILSARRSRLCPGRVW